MVHKSSKTGKYELFRVFFRFIDIVSMACVSTTLELFIKDHNFFPFISCQLIWVSFHVTLYTPQPPYNMVRYNMVLDIPESLLVFVCLI